jgi:Protein phosphatase 2C
MQIGDGFLVMRSHLSRREAILANDFSKSGDYRLVFQPDKGEFANQTTFVTSSTALQEMQVKVLPIRKSFICASTDGLERVALRLKDWDPFPPFFHPLEEFLRESDRPDQNDDYLVQFLESDRLNARTDDDKTVLLCLYEE